MVLKEKVKNGAILWLNRPEKKNALNKGMISQMLEILNEYETDEQVRYIIIRGKGDVYSAGADISWMKNSATNREGDNYEEAKLLATFFHRIYHFSKPVVSIVHGAAIGGAVGMVAASDVAYCSDDTVFAFSEIKLGIIPATISPFVLKRIGEFYSKELMLTGRKFDGKEAGRMGLVNRSFPNEQLEEQCKQLINLFDNAGPNAMKACKELIHNVQNEWDQSEIIEETSRQIAEIRATAEAQEGLNSFLEKRKPNWVNR